MGVCYRQGEPDARGAPDSSEENIMARTITLSQENVQAVEAAYATYYAVATRPDAYSWSADYQQARLALRRVIRANVKGLLTADMERLEECLSDNVGFTNTLPGNLRHLGYDVDDSQNVYARTYAEAREELARQFPITGGFDAQRGMASYVLGRMEGTVGGGYFGTLEQARLRTDDRTARAIAAAWLRASSDHADAERAAAQAALSR